MKRGYLLVMTLLAIILLLLLVFLNNTRLSITGFAVDESQPGPTTGNDTYIRQNSNTAYGTATTITIGKTAGGAELRGLIKFNTSFILAGDTVVSAKVQVNLSYSSNNNNVTVKVYRATTDWEQTQAGWFNATSSQLWSTQGGDYSEEITSFILSNTTTLYNFTISSLVRGWINGSYSNYGFILVSDGASNGDYKIIDSSNSASSTARPKLIVDHTGNAPPSITGISTNSNLTNLKKVGETINFTITWLDLEGANTQTYVCNSSNISFASGCADQTFCSTSLASTNPAICFYNVTSSENRTTSFFSAVCDSYNCSDVNQSYFYVNHVPTILVVQPNGSETVNQSQGNYSIKFNVSDADNDALFANIYYGDTQNSTTYSIYSNLNLTNYCTDADSSTSTTNNCSYSWNSTDLYGTYYLTIIANDSYDLTNDSSDNSFDIRSVTENVPPNISAQWIEANSYSGKQIQIATNVSDQSTMGLVWVSINTTPQTNLTLTNASDIIYNVSWTATNAGMYQFKTYAQDIAENLNDTMPWQTFTIYKPNATTQNESAPTIVLPYHTIKIIGELNANDSLRDVYAYLNAPSGFTFLTDYPQNSLLGNFSAGQVKTATWFLSVPITEATYTLNITYTDDYSNTWNSSSFNVQVTSDVGGGYDLDVSGYPEVQASGSYYSEAHFKLSGVYTNPDSTEISLYDPVGNLIVGPVDMTLKETGIYNYTYSVPASPTTGQWETIVNATKSSISYYANQFWKVVGALFDIRDIVIVSSNISSLNISVITENAGTGSADLTLAWNLTRTDTDQQLDAGGETFAVGAIPLTKYYSPSTTYVGQVKITFLGRYSGTETAGAYEIFSTTSGTTPPVTPPSDGGGGGGGGGGSTIPPIEKGDLTIEVDKIVYLTRNIPKTILLKINNTGEKDLTNISLDLENLDKFLYTKSPKTINLLKIGETKTFEIRFIVVDILEEQEFNYLIKTNEITKREPGKIVILSILDYLQKEVERLTDRVEDTKSEMIEDALKEEIKKCEDIIEDVKSQISEEEFIIAVETIQEADECIDDIRKKMFKKADLFWAILLTSLIMLIVIVLFILKKVYKKFSILRFLNTQLKTKPKTDPKPMGETYFEEKLKRIREGLEG